MTITLDRGHVEYLDNAPSLPIVGSPPQFNPLVEAGFLRPWFVNGVDNSLTGDASGGTARFAFQFRPQLGDEPIFATIAQLVVWTDDTNAQFCKVDPLGANWSYPLHRQVELDVTNTVIPTFLISPDNPAVLGKGDTGVVLGFTVSFQINTLAKIYFMSAMGWMADRPFMTPINVLPM